MSLKDRFKKVRDHSEFICEKLNKEDFTLQPVEFVSPAKWHLAHTTWFFEEFILTSYAENYQVFDEKFSYLFNSYYESVGDRVARDSRGGLSRPSVEKVFEYRAYVNEHMMNFLESATLDESQAYLVELGLNHEQQHQELCITDVKYSLSTHPLLPVYDKRLSENNYETTRRDDVHIEEGVYEIGFKGDGFSFDNEHGPHKVFIHQCKVSGDLVTHGEYIDFINDNAYQRFDLWLAEGWDWVQKENIQSPAYWFKKDGSWWQYTTAGPQLIDENQPVRHVSYFEADAFARWKRKRLPTEFEWEVASKSLDYGHLWEWTGSAYLPYPGFKTAKGAVGEYNGKFMINQMVLRGGSLATSKGHVRPTYRNFFHPHLRWQYTGIRLAGD